MGFKMEPRQFALVLKVLLAEKLGLADSGASRRSR